MKVNKISLKQQGGENTEQVEAQPQQQSVDPAIQQISDFISQAISQGQNPAEVVMSLVEQQVDQQTIGQALMMNGFEENDIMSLFEQMSQGQQPEEQVGGEPMPADQLDQTSQQLTEDESMHSDDMSEEETQEPGMSMGKSGIEIKPENEGKFTRWAEARGMSVQEAASRVMSNTDEYPPAVVKMANFAKNAAGWNKEYGGENYQMGGVPQGKVASVDNVNARNKDMNWQRAPLYFNPMELEYSNDNFSLGKAAAVAYGGYKEFLSGDDKNKDGIKDGFFRDGSKKSAIRDASKGNYYNYEITKDVNDPNTYKADNLDLFNASKNKGNLRTSEQFDKDVMDYSRFNYNVDTNGYDGIKSSRPIDERIYNSAGNKNALAGKDFNYFKEFLGDKDTREMLLGTQDDPEAGLLSIDQYGQDSSVRPGSPNPYEYNTYMGINKRGVNQNAMIPTGSNGQPAPSMFNIQPAPVSMMNAIPSNTSTDTPQKSFQQWYASGDAVRNQGKNQEQLKSEYDAYLKQGFKYGGDLDKAQFGIPQGFDFSSLTNFDDPFGMNDPRFGQTANYADTAGYNQQQTLAANNPATNTTAGPTAPTTPTFGPPKVERTNKLEGGLNRFMDSPGVQGYAKVSDFAVKAANVANDWFRDQTVNQAREDNFNKLGADYQYATAEDPFNKRGMWDVNTGTAGSEGDRTVGLYMSKYGGENNTVNVDSNLLAKLIAAGADIEIL